jgi:hypothetical protein
MPSADPNWHNNVSLHQLLHASTSMQLSFMAPEVSAGKLPLYRQRCAASSCCGCLLGATHRCQPVVTAPIRNSGNSTARHACTLLSMRCASSTCPRCINALAALQNAPGLPPPAMCTACGSSRGKVTLGSTWAVGFKAHFHRSCGMQHSRALVLDVL